MVPKTHQKHLAAVPARITFGQALRQARIAGGFSQEELAELAGLHRTYIGQIERGERNVSVDNMEHLAIAVGCELWAMLRPPSGGG